MSKEGLNLLVCLILLPALPGHLGSKKRTGSSSGFSIFSPRGLRWISEKTGSRDLERLVDQVFHLDPETWDQGCWNKFVDVTWHPIPQDQHEPFPEKDIALKYVEGIFLYNYVLSPTWHTNMNLAFFNTCNSIFPVFNRTIFDRRFERQYSDNPPTGTGWYASFNMVLAIGSALDTEHPLANPNHIMRRALDLSQGPSAKWLRNATSVFLDIQFGPATLLSVQALVIMVSLLPIVSYIPTEHLH